MQVLVRELLDWQRLRAATEPSATSPGVLVLSRRLLCPVMRVAWREHPNTNPVWDARECANPRRLDQLCQHVPPEARGTGGTREAARKPPSTRLWLCAAVWCWPESPQSDRMRPRPQTYRPASLQAPDDDSDETLAPHQMQNEVSLYISPPACLFCF